LSTSETPFGLAQATQGFVKMKALGLDPTRAALTSFGNTASAMGKDLNQMIEAVADASTGEFERLKEFGIKASRAEVAVHPVALSQDDLVERVHLELVNRGHLGLSQYFRRLRHRIINVRCNNKTGRHHNCNLVFHF
jgi:diaminopimelate decarboxylase